MADSGIMSILRVLTVFASLVVLAAMLFLVFNGPIVAGFAEMITLVLVLGLTVFLGVLTYEPRAIWHSLVRFGSRNREKRDPQAMKIMAQLALYALVSGIIFAIIQILSASVSQGEMEKKLALWSLLYGVLVAVGFWVISGVDKPAMSCTDQDSPRGEDNQVILAFCVLLLTVGVLSLLFVEMQKVDRYQTPIQTGKLSADLMDTGLQLGDDMIWRPSTFTRKESEIKPSPPLAHHATRNQTNRPGLGTSVAIKPAEAALRWELSLE